MNKHRNTKFQELKRPPVRYTEGLPILERKDEILSAIIKNQVIIVAGETGSGKTTQLPVICLEAGRGRYGKIGCTQPRRIAAISIARRVAEELGCNVGEEVGYKIRFHDHDSPSTSVKFMTDGILLAEIEKDPSLRCYDTLIIDEAHERSLNIDFLLGYLRKLLPKRPDLKLIISSATIDTRLFSESFGNAPVIEVSGRLYPVELFYLSDDNKEDSEETYVDSAVKAAEDLLDLYPSGDMLIFMPSERDIRESCDRLTGLHRPDLLVLPLFSRLSRSEQELIFKQSDKRKIVVATNIAETSITVPNIRFVVDTGLARISQYVPRLRTNRLPIESVSRASADQRKGRCGRVMDGVCIRLYSEQSFLERDQFTTPEIKRANLAGVILSMMAHRLGDIETFPFLEPPSRNAVSEGYALLRELGAIDSSNNLTPLGKKLAQFPLDPHIARMIIAAKEENALREVLIIAAGLSIVDPRERPFDKQAEADTMHKKFTVTGSDFLGLVKLWDAYQQEWDSLKTQNKMRKFCKDHFLSFNRMQEWHDVHQMLSETVKGMKGFVINSNPASPDAIHRSLLTGLLSNCAHKTDTGRYRGFRGKELLIFPGSSLYGNKPEWIVCHEIVETSQVFARTVSPIDPSWLEQLASHLITKSYSEPWFDSETGFVRATERISLFGMQIVEHTGVSFGKINPTLATEIFIRQGLVEEQLNGSYPFYNNNKSVRREIENIERKLRSRTLFAGEAAIEQFYASKLSNVSSVHDLNRIIKEKGSDKFLFMTRDDLLVSEIPESATDFPDRVTIGDKKFPLKYAFEPGAESDGITLRVPVKDIHCISANSLGYLLPALWPAKILELLRGLPKETRKKLMPLNEKAEELSKVIFVSSQSFEHCLAEAIEALYGVSIDPMLLSESNLPDHLALRIEVHDDKGKVISAGRGAGILKAATRNAKGSLPGKNDAFSKYEKSGLTGWPGDSIPDHIEVIKPANGVPLYGYPALKDSGSAVDFVLCKSASEAQKTHLFGVKKLMEISLTDDFAWIEREIRFTQPLKLLCAPLGGVDRIRNSLIMSIREFLLDFGTDIPRNKLQFDKALSEAHNKTRGIGYEVLSLLENTLQQYNINIALIRKEKNARFAPLKQELTLDLDSYIREITGEIRFTRFRQFPRYLKAFGLRIQKSFLEPLKYRQKKQELTKYSDTLEKLTCKEIYSPLWYGIEEYHAMIEEYGISLFAQQEIKTLFPVSGQRLDKKLAQLKLLQIKT
ncbi:MAG TPA: ATP-dependent RNA helicase HrpA [Chitinispirillaceae bacterium]|nr:ATP-dependent RNA helicase HrpA [Chitinispirillaceae bacterium]